MTIKNLFPTVRPALDLNFAQTKRLDPRITYSRASAGTYFDANGVLQSAPAGVARFDHNPETGESLGLLLEEARTNLLQYSQDITNVAWAKSNATVTKETLAGPAGTVPYDKITLGTFTNTSGRADRNAVSTSQSVFYTASIYAKAGTCRYIGLTSKNYDSNGWGTYFDLVTGVVTQNRSSTTFSILSVGNGWYRLSIGKNVGVGGSTPNLAVIPLTVAVPANGPSNNIQPLYNGNGESLYVWAPQFEAGSLATSYIPTVASTVTRAADVCTVTNSNIYDTDSFTIINQPFGASAGTSTLTLFDGPEPIKRATVYTTDLSQATINTAAGKTDEFWRWRVLGSSFALPNFTTNGSVTVDWGDGVVETLTTATHTFSNGSGYHDIGFRLNSGTYFRPYINDNASIDTKVVALGPAPESMKLNALYAFSGCSNLEVFDATVDTTGGTSFFYAWRNCSSLTSFPLINTAAGTIFFFAWYGCSSLTSFPLINTAAGTNFGAAWAGCSSLTSFPLINTAAGTDFNEAWNGCSSLASFPLINTAAGTNFSAAWRSCSSLTSFPLINTAAGTSFVNAWNGCSGLTSFPLIDTAAGTNFQQAWRDCSSLTDFPANFFDSWTGTPANNCFVNAWDNCYALTATSVENILNSIDTSGQSAPASGVNITIDYNAGTGTPSVATAITNLQSRGWTITLNGVLQ